MVNYDVISTLPAMHFSDDHYVGVNNGKDSDGRKGSVGGDT
jgi:hypothetical protein